MSFADKTIIVTGATSGIGRAAARAFGGNRGSVVVVGRQETELAEVYPTHVVCKWIGNTERIAPTPSGRTRSASAMNK